MSLEKIPIEAKDGDVDSPQMAAASSDLTIDPAAEKRLLRKLDAWLAPMMIIAFLVAYLDRSNIGMLFRESVALIYVLIFCNYRQRSDCRHD